MPYENDFSQLPAPDHSAKWTVQPIVAERRPRPVQNLLSDNADNADENMQTAPHELQLARA
jgi:hypothetical protein